MAFYEDIVFWEGVLIGALLLFGAIKLYWPEVVRKIKEKVFEAQAYVEANLDKVPEDYRPVVEDFYALLREFELALIDDEISWQEAETLGLRTLAIYEEVKNIVEKKC